MAGLIVVRDTKLCKPTFNFSTCELGVRQCFAAGNAVVDAIGGEFSRAVRPCRTSLNVNILLGFPRLCVYERLFPIVE